MNSDEILYTTQDIFTYILFLITECENASEILKDLMIIYKYLIKNAPANK